MALDSSTKKERLSSFAQSILKEIVEFKGWEIIFQVLLYGFLLWGIYNLGLLYEFHTSEQWAHVRKYSLYEFKLSLIMVAIFVGYKNACQYLFLGWAKSILNPEKYPTEEEKLKKAKLISVWIGSAIYYTCTSTFVIVFFRDQDFFPKLFGGRGEPLDMFKSMPNAPHIPYGVEFYMVQFGHHAHTLIDYIVYKRQDPKFWEMFLHHCLAVFLIFFSYATNNVAVGIMVLFVHDPCDIFFYLNRILADVKYNVMPLKAAIYLTFLTSWIFFRLYAFLKCIIAGCFDFLQISGPPFTSSYLFMALMLTALVILHFYWLVFILRAGIVILVKKSSNYNVYDKNKKKAEPEKTNNEKDKKKIEQGKSS